MPLISNIRDKIAEYVYKRFMSNYLHDDYPISKIKTNYTDGDLFLNMNNVVLDENALNRKLSNIYYLNGGFLHDEDSFQDNFNLPIVFTDQVTVGCIKIRLPLFKLLQDNSHVEVEQTKIYLKLNLLSQLISKQLRTNLQESFRNSLMNSSIQIAEDLISNSQNNNLTEDFELSDKYKGYEGYEQLANVIRKVLSRIEFKFTDFSIFFTDNSNTTKVEFRLKRVEIIDEFEETQDEDERAYQDQDDANNKTLIKLIDLEGVEIYVNDSLISRTSAKHQMKYDIEQNSIEMVIGSILNFVLNPAQLDALIGVFSNRADESNLLHLKSNKTEFKDKKISADEMSKVKEYIDKERNRATSTKASSNKLSINKLNQLWSTGNEEHGDDVKFYEFDNNDEITNETTKKDKTKEMNPFNLQAKIPGISICLLNTTENEHIINELDNVRLDLLEINQHIQLLYKTDCLHLVILNSFVHYRDLINIKLSNLMLCETYKGITEQVIFNNGDGTTISENIYVDFDLNENQINFTSKQEILINVDLTLYERLHNYLNFDRIFKSKNSSDLMIDSTILKNDDQLETSEFSFNLDVKNLNGKLFIPVPNLTDNLPRQISDLHDDCIEFNSTNIILKVNSKELKVYSDFIELNLLENYVPFREDQQQTKNEKSIQLISSKVCEFRSLGLLKNLIELQIIFKPDVNGNILNDGKQQQSSTTKPQPKFNAPDQFLGDNLEDSVFITNAYNLDSVSYQAFRTKSRKIVSDESQHEAEKILPNDKISSINYLNSAAKVSSMNIILSVPQALILFSDQDQLNLVYNRFANDLLLWVPFNGVNSDGERTKFKSNQSTSNKQHTKSNFGCKILESDGNLIEIDENFAHFDANVFNYSKMAQKKQQNLMNESFMGKGRDYLEASMNHFDSKPSNMYSSSFRMCKSGLEESTESDSAMYHSLNYSTVNPIYDLVNNTTFVVTVNEIVVHLEHKVKEDDIETASRLNQNTASSPTLNSKLNSIHEFFSNYQLVENQAIVGKKLLVGCVAKMEKDNTTRVFIHGEDVRFKMNNLGPVNKLQSACVHNNQFLMIGSNKLVNSTGDCKLNLGVEIKRESKDLKKIKIAIQLIDALMLQINVSEIMKFWNYVNVTDEEVIGYVPPSILTELHVNLINTALMIEPECFCNNFNNPFYSSSRRTSALKNVDRLNFSNECPNCENLTQLENRPGLLLFNDASIVCLIMENTADVMLKFTFDETSLFFVKQLPNYDQKFDNCRQMSNNQLKEAYYALDSLSLSNYVCNMSCGSLEIDIMLKSGSIKEIKMNNDIINIICCYDSLAALVCHLRRLLQSDKNTSSSNNTSSKSDPDLSIEQRENNTVFHDNDSIEKPQERQFYKSGDILGEINSNILNTPPYSNKSQSPLLYDPSYLDDDEEDLKINAANQIRVHKQPKKPTIDSSFYILGYDDFGTGIKVSKNSEPEYNSLSSKSDPLQDTYFTVPQMVNVPIFCQKRTLFRFLLEEMSITLNLFGGTDFQENLISSNSSEDLKGTADLDDAMSIGERRSSLSSCSSYGSPNPNRTTTVRFADTTQNLANERTYDKTSSLNANLTKFDYLAANFGHQLFIFKKQVNDDFFEHIKSTDRRKSFGIGDKEDGFWEDLDLFAHNLTDGLRSSANVAIIKKNGGYKRDQQLSVKLELRRMKCLFEKYIDSNPIAWNASYACSEIELVDCVKKSCINKMLYEYISEKLPKRSQPMLSIKIVNNRNLICDQKIFADGRIEQKKRRHHSTSSQASEYSSNVGSLGKPTKRMKRVYDSNSSDCDLIISMNPLRVNIDQDTILFLMDFFTDFSILLEKAATVDCGSTTTLNEQQNKQSNFSPSDSLVNQAMPDYQSMQRDTSSIKSGSSNSSTSTRDCNKQPIFIKHFEFSQDVPIKLNYQGKKVDMTNGAIQGILLGLGRLDDSELTLKSFSHCQGLLGMEKCLLFAIGVWANDIKKYQLPSILGGVGPVNSFVQLFRGIRDLFVMPIDQYRKDKRLVRGLQKGLFSFSTSSTIALLELTNKSLGLIEFAAQILYDLMSGTGSLRKERALSSNYEFRWNQPRDTREGALNAYNVLTEGFQQASRNLTLHGESNGALSLIRKLPANAFILPILTTQATSNIITGVRNHLQPQARQEDQMKYKKLNR